MKIGGWIEIRKFDVYISCVGFFKKNWSFN